MTSYSSKWTAKFWEDTFERVGSTAIYGLITFLTLGGSDTVAWDKIWPVIVLPAILSLLKALLVNMGSSDGASASLVGVKSKTVDVPPAG